MTGKLESWSPASADQLPKITNGVPAFQAFPSYYVLDREHRIVRRDIGYSTQLGLWWRAWVIS
ncbi:MAG: hypothetical protein WBN05_08900 [Woeseiaceae bacterium]